MSFFRQIFKKKVETELKITSANGFHLRPIARFVNEAKRFKTQIYIKAKGQEVSAKQVPKLLSLGLDKGDSFVLYCVGKESQKASKHLSSFFKEIMDEDNLNVVEEIKQENESYEASTLNGETIAKGVAISSIVIYKKIEQKENPKELSIQEAIDKTQEELTKLYEANKTKDEAHIYLAQKELLNSDIFNKDFDNIDQEIDKLKGTKFESRVADYQDLKQRILSYMGIKTKLKLPNTPYILLANDLLPSEVSTIANTPIQGVILQKGTPTSHASILLRSEAIPSIIINDNICKDNSCDAPNIILDANSGNLILKPTENDLKKAQIKQKKFKEQQAQSYKKRFESTKTKDGKDIQILANIADFESAKEAKEQGADGIGLFRTEFLFTETKPTLEQQTKAYSEIFSLFDTITIRTLDIGGDKSLPYIDIPKEDNPFLGIRGVRFSLQEQTLFKEQLQAIFIGATISKNKNPQTIKIMFPMVSSIDEFIQAKNISIEIAKKNNINIDNIQFGIMLEIPCVIFAIKEFDKIVDFYSIGTNDLTQYLFAIERTHPTLTADATSPMVFSALKQIIDTTKKPISICGELAGLEEATSQLVNMGYTTLSVSSKLIPMLKERIRAI